jgi:hypothetical protein
VVHSYNPSTEQPRQKGKFEVILGYMASTCLKKKRNKTVTRGELSGRALAQCVRALSLLSYCEERKKEREGREGEEKKRGRAKRESTNKINKWPNIGNKGLNSLEIEESQIKTPVITLCVYKINKDSRGISGSHL